MLLRHPIISQPIIPEMPQASQSNKGSLKLANQGKTCQTIALFA